jgi:hypothetical protein
MAGGQGASEEKLILNQALLSERVQRLKPEKPMVSTWLGEARLPLRIN